MLFGAVYFGLDILWVVVYLLFVDLWLLFMCTFLYEGFWVVLGGLLCLIAVWWCLRRFDYDCLMFCWYLCLCLVFALLLCVLWLRYSCFRLGLVVITYSVWGSLLLLLLLVPCWVLVFWCLVDGFCLYLFVVMFNSTLLIIVGFRALFAISCVNFELRFACLVDCLTCFGCGLFAMLFC